MDGVNNNDAATLALLGAAYNNNREYRNDHCRSGFDSDGSVIASKVEANRDIASIHADRLNDSQQSQFDRIADLQTAISRDNAEFRAAERAFSNERAASDRAASLDRFLYNEFSQVDRRFSDAALAAAECCCELKAGQATILAKIDAQDQVRAAMVQAEQGAKLDALLGKYQ